MKQDIDTAVLPQEFLREMQQLLKDEYEDFIRQYSHEKKQANLNSRDKKQPQSRTLRLRFSSFFSGSTGAFRGDEPANQAKRSNPTATRRIRRASEERI